MIMIATLISGCGGTPAASSPAPANSAPSGSALSASAKNDAIKFKFGHVDGTTSPKQKFAEKLNELLNERLNENISWRFIHSHVGGERDLVEAVVMDLWTYGARQYGFGEFVPALNAVELRICLKA
jgi:TRAP-type C4-dicarboxylate transport system substrate-binding protein